MQEYLQSPLQFVRLATFSHGEIIKEVLTTEILTAAEVLRLLMAITNKLPWEVNGFCKTQESRELTKKSSTCIDTKECYVFSSCGSYCTSERYNERYSSTDPSVFSIKTNRAIEIKKFGFMSRSFACDDKQPVYEFGCTIAVRIIKGTNADDFEVVRIEGVVPYEEELLFPLKLSSGQPLRLEANSWYLFTVEFTSPHPPYTLSCLKEQSKCYESSTYYKRQSGGNMTIKFKTPLHIRKIIYEC